MSSVVYKLSKKEREDGKSRILVWLLWNRQTRVQIKSSIFITTSLFRNGSISIPKRGRLNFKEIEEAQNAQAKLQDYTSKLYRICDVTPERDLTKEYILKAAEIVADWQIEDITYKAIQDALNPDATQKAYDFFECAEWYLREKDIAYNQVRNFKSIFRCMHRWQEYRRIKDHDFIISLDRLVTFDLQDFKEYCKHEAELCEENKELFERLLNDYPAEITQKHKGRIEERGENTIVKNLKRLKAFWRWCLDKKITANDPFDGFELGEAKYGIPFYLTIEERNLVADFDLSSRPALEMQRDIFIFQCLVGCRVSDLYALTDANIHNGILEYVPIKTSDNIQQVKPRIPLNERASALVGKYKGMDAKQRLFPFISMQKYNDAIKEALKVCGIDRNVPVRNSLTGKTEMKPLYEVASSHMARRTFVGCLYKKVRDPNLIGKMSGHVEGSRAFARYRQIDDDVLKETINLLD